MCLDFRNLVYEKLSILLSLAAGFKGWHKVLEGNFKCRYCQVQVNAFNLGS